MPIGSTGRIIKVVLVVILILLLVVEFFSLFVGLAFVILPGVKKNLVHYGLFMVITAALLICLAFIGLCGAVRECYLKLFVFSGLLIAVLLVSLLVHFFMLPSETGDEGEGDEDVTGTPSRKREVFEYITEGYNRLNLHTTDYNNSNFSRKSWDETHRKFRCCGMDGPQSWLKSNQNIPFSCCHSQDNSSDPILERCRESGYGDYVYEKGCFKLRDYPVWKGSIDDKEENESEGASNVTMVTIIRTAGYFIQLAAVILAIWLGVLILLSYHCGYY
ncbi:hypothetical protein HHI36_008867 [Cryptolaemus montrouzieri]|uniref:Tetraspanin n=1 Tax=Cryptolaemus montrouzieri TaxID=559131 RepID=A0ABD2MTN1_9CUCU